MVIQERNNIVMKKVIKFIAAISFIKAAV